MHCIQRSWLALSLLLSAATPTTPVLAQEVADSTSHIRFHYGGGTPNDAGPLGHCVAMISRDGMVRIESKGRRGVPGPSNVIVYETKSLDATKVDLIFKAADAALREPPFNRAGANEDGDFLRLERSGHAPTQVSHNQLREFSEAPPAMQDFVILINQLLPAKERIPLKQAATPIRQLPAKTVHSR